MKEGKYAAPEANEDFAAEHKKSLKRLKKNLPDKDISFSWILRLAHLNDVSDICRCKHCVTIWTKVKATNVTWKIMNESKMSVIN